MPFGEFRGSPIELRWRRPDTGRPWSGTSFTSASMATTCRKFATGVGAREHLTPEERDVARARDEVRRPARIGVEEHSNFQSERLGLLGIGSASRPATYNAARQSSGDDTGCEEQI